jgi:hypothetical protein
MDVIPVVAVHIREGLSCSQLGVRVLSCPQRRGPGLVSRAFLMVLGWNHMAEPVTRPHGSFNCL